MSALKKKRQQAQLASYELRHHVLPPPVYPVHFGLPPDELAMMPPSVRMHVHHMLPVVHHTRSVTRWDSMQKRRMNARRRIAPEQDKYIQECIQAGIFTEDLSGAHKSAFNELAALPDRFHVKTLTELKRLWRYRERKYFQENPSEGLRHKLRKADVPPLLEDIAMFAFANPNPVKFDRSQCRTLIVGEPLPPGAENDGDWYFFTR